MIQFSFHNGLLVGINANGDILTFKIYKPQLMATNKMESLLMFNGAILTIWIITRTSHMMKMPLRDYLISLTHFTKTIKDTSLS